MATFAVLAWTGSPASPTTPSFPLPRWKYRLFDLLPALAFCHVPTAEVVTKRGEFTLAARPSEQERLEMLLSDLEDIQAEGEGELARDKIAGKLLYFHRVSALS